MPPSSISSSLIEIAKQRIEVKPGITESHLRRATSDLYYAMFHKLCETLASALRPVEPADIFREAYQTLYRYPKHGYIAKRCRDKKIARFEQPMQLFSQQFVSFKDKRERADYDPVSKMVMSEVRNDIEIVETVLARFDSCPEEHRFCFAVFVAFEPTRVIV